jgi:hypothetical protein
MSKRIFRKVPCSHCGREIGIATLSRHENVCLSKQKICPHCNSNFIEKWKDQKFCSLSCSNTSNAKKPRKDNVYTTICFQHHEKKCVVCEERNIVATHHYDGNHSNNEPSNLVPLCPTHHSYVHSKFKSLIKDQIDLYVAQFNNLRV